MSARKPRGDSKLDALTPKQHEQLCAWLTMDNHTYDETRALVLEEFGVSTTPSALCSYFGKVAAPWKYARAKGQADTFAELMQGKFDTASIKKLQQLGFEALTSPVPNIDAAKTFFKILGDSAKLDLAKEKLHLDAEKFRQLIKSNVEKGLDAMHEEIKNNTKSLALFEKFKASVMESMETAKQ